MPVIVQQLRKLCDYAHQSDLHGAMGSQEMMRDFENQEQQDGDEDEADQVLSESKLLDDPKCSKVPPPSPTYQKLVYSFGDPRI